MNSSNKYLVIPVKKDVLSIEECIQLSKQIENQIRNAEKFLVLDFCEEIIVTGSFLGFLIEQIRQIESVKGEICIVTRNENLLDIIRLTRMDALVRIYPSLEHLETEKGICSIKSAKI